MALFGFGKKKEELNITGSCSCGTTITNGSFPGHLNSVDDGEIKSVKVLGSGCKNCHNLYENAKKAIYVLGINVEVEYVTNMEKIMAYGVMSMPALVINEKVVSMGKVLKEEDIMQLLKK